LSIIIDQTTRVLVTGITGREGSFHTKQCLDYGTKVVAGVTPGKGGQEIFGIPVFNTVAEATERTRPNAAMIFVPAPFAADSVLECEDSKIPFVTLITEGVPVLDMLRVVNLLKTHQQTKLLGGNCPGIISPGKCKMGIMPAQVFTPGPVGVVSRSGTLTYEIVLELTKAGLGQSSCAGVGGDPLSGLRFKDILHLFENDLETKAVVLVGEIGGTDEEEAAKIIKKMTKPVVAFISGRTAPPGKRMGHAGAIISGKIGTPQSKVQALQEAGVQIADETSSIPELVKQALQNNDLNSGAKNIYVTQKDLLQEPKLQSKR